METSLLKVFDFLENTRDDLFITGAAGTGKSTLLRYFFENTRKRVAVVAPTGIAAIHVGGQTIHSLLNLPQQFIQRDNVRISGHHQHLLENLDALIIDEVSMVRADLMDGIDEALRLNRREPHIPFGGVQMLMFGDLQQLPPVLDRDLGPLFGHIYQSPYFFSAHVFSGKKIKGIRLQTIYRQLNDEPFLRLLRHFRNNEMNEDDLTLLNTRVTPHDLDDPAIVLTPRNAQAALINRSKLATFGEGATAYKAAVTGEFGESSYPADEQLFLKKGAQVMFLQNDVHHRWVNGDVGRVLDMSHDAITVNLRGQDHDVMRGTWEMKRHTFNTATDQIESQIIGTFSQFPLRLAWAITIHKSQGQTFDRVHIDMGRGAFAHGQTYVGLSRCRTLAGLSLTRPITWNDLQFDNRVLEFDETVQWQNP